MVADLPSDREPPDRTLRFVGPSGSAEGSLERIWLRLRQPVDPIGAVRALVGIPQRTARQVIGAAIAGSDEATDLLGAMPGLIRNLSISTVSVPERCAGEIRGAILWSETMAARASSAGDPGVFVCSTVNRAYDTPENQLLVSALRAIARGGRDVERFHDDEDEEPELLVQARRHGDLAQRYLDHRTLIDVRPARARRRTARRIRHDPRRRDYRPVAAMLRRAAEPLSVGTIRLFCNEVTTARHDLLVATVDHLETRGIRIPTFLITDNQLVAGPVRFRHPALAAGEHAGGAGLTVASTRLDVPGGGAGDDTIVVRNRGDLVRAVDAAIIDDEL